MSSSMSSVALRSAAQSTMSWASVSGAGYFSRHAGTPVVVADRRFIRLKQGTFACHLLASIAPPRRYPRAGSDAGHPPKP